jgi:hypothetical protein
MNWRSDTIASLFNCSTLANNQATAARNLARGLFAIVRRTVLNPSNLVSMPEIMKSLLSEVIDPSLALAEKVSKIIFPHLLLF